MSDELPHPHSEVVDANRRSSTEWYKFFKVFVSAVFRRGITVWDTITLKNSSVTGQQSGLFRTTAITGITDNAQAEAGGYQIKNNTADADDFSSTLPVEYFMQNYSQTFNAGFFWNPPNIAIGDDSTRVLYGTNFTIASSHALSQDRATAAVTTLSGAARVTGVTVSVNPPYSYSAVQSGIQVKVFNGSGYAEHGTCYASAGGTGILVNPSLWTRNANGTGGTPFDGIDAGLGQDADSLNPGLGFSNTPSILIQPPNPPGPPYVFGLDGGPTLVLARTIAYNPDGTSTSYVAGTGSVVGPIQFAIQDASAGWVPTQCYAIVTNSATTSQGTFVIGTPDTKTGAVKDRFRVGKGVFGADSAGSFYADKGAGTTNFNAYWLTGASTDTGTGALDYSSNTVRLRSVIDGEPIKIGGTAASAKTNVMIGDAAVAITATVGFPHIPTCAGTMTSTPSTFSGMAPIVWDSTNNQFNIYSGGAWRVA